MARFQTNQRTVRGQRARVQEGQGGLRWARGGSGGDSTGAATSEHVGHMMENGASCVVKLLRLVTVLLLIAGTFLVCHMPKNILNIYDLYRIGVQVVGQPNTTSYNQRQPNTTSYS